MNNASCEFLDFGYNLDKIIMNKKCYINKTPVFFYLVLTVNLSHCARAVTFSYFAFHQAEPVVDEMLH
jgi:hypothetical protein